MKLIFAVFFLILGLFALPTQAGCGEGLLDGLEPLKDFSELTQDVTVCPNTKKLRGLCMYVGDHEKDPNPQGRFVWTYQRKLLEAACIDVKKENEEEIGKKIAKLWLDNEKTLICNNTQFVVSNGNLIKYAVSVQFDEFLINMSQWKVNFNKVDETDGRTVLDFVKDQIIRNKGLAAERTMKRYYEMIRKAGARHKWEL